MPVIAGLAAIAAIVIVRAAILYTPGAPDGIDAGNWLAFGTFARPGILYPPMVPLLFAALANAFGPVLATVVAGATSPAASAIVVLGALTWAGRPVTGVMAAILIVSSAASGEVAAWDGYPQLLATAFALLALVALARWLLDGSIADLAVFTISFAGVITTSHLIAVPTGGAMLLLFADSAIRSRRLGHRIVIAAALSAPPLILLEPTYAALFATVQRLGSPHIADLRRVLTFVWPAYLAALIAAPIGWIFVVRGQSRAAAMGPRNLSLLKAASAASVSWVLVYVVSGQPRFLHDLPVIAYVGLAAVTPIISPALSRLGGWRRVVAPVTVLAVSIAAAVGLAHFPTQVTRYHILSTDRFAALEWVAGHVTASPPAVLVADVKEAPLGWWAEAIIQEEVLFGSNLKWLRFPSELERATLANNLLYRSGFPMGDSARAVSNAGVQFVFLPSAAAFGVTASSPPPGWRVAFASGDAVVLSPAVDSVGAAP